MVESDDGWGKEEVETETEMAIPDDVASKASNI